MDRGTARTFVANKIEDPDVTRFSADKYNDAIELAERQFAIDTKVLVNETTLTVTAGASEIDLPTDFIKAVTVEHKGLPLQQVTRQWLIKNIGDDWTDETGTPTHCYVDDENEKIGLFPQPQSVDAGANLRLTYSSFPATISADGTTLLDARSLLEIYHPAVVAYAAWWMMSYESVTPEAQAKRRDLKGEYDSMVADAISTYGNMVDAPIRLTGGRDWQQGPGGTIPNAFTD